VTKVLVNFLQRPMVFSNLFGVSVRNLSEEKQIIKTKQNFWAHLILHDKLIIVKIESFVCGFCNQLVSKLFVNKFY
jgi:hypothetical protein